MALCPNRCGSLLNVLFALAFLGFFAYSGNQVGEPMSLRKVQKVAQLPLPIALQIVHVISPPASASGSGTINPTWKVRHALRGAVRRAQLPRVFRTGWKPGSGTGRPEHAGDQRLA